ncbi:hypothetical protein L6164_013884 [Bauhinia variegata]|uniref:Uncharacterized protein n=1 Tax=Bauhinia variegata TaxID=167791 RepID=A0ACB9NFG3_BAUVA|nr:hypothetical protein L6164_013884 [Bauhinia variegata]
MSISRSPETLPTKTIPKTIVNHIEPVTPTQTNEVTSHPSSISPKSRPNLAPGNTGFGSGSVPVAGLVRRRSLRLASKLDFAECPIKSPTSGRRCKRKGDSGGNGACLAEDGKVESEIAGEVASPSVSPSENGGMNLDSSGSTIRVFEVEEKFESNAELGESGSGSAGDESNYDSLISGSKSSEEKGKRKLNMNNFSASECKADEGSQGFLNLRSGKRVVKRGMELGNPSFHGNDHLQGKIAENSKYPERGDDLGNGISTNKNGSAKRSRKTRKEDKRKEESEKGDSTSTGIDAVKLNFEFETHSFTGHAVQIDDSKLVDERKAEGGDRRGKKKLGDTSEQGVVTGNMEGGASVHHEGSTSRKRLSREEKGKGPMTEDELSPNVIHKAELALESKKKSSGDNSNSDVNRLTVNNAALQNQEELRNTNARGNRFMERFRDIARENASRFAHFAADEEDDHSSPEAEVEPETEDWPGPFSTAMKIIEDRAKKSMLAGSASSERKAASITWVPKRDKGQICAKVSVPSLQELSLNIVAKNADALVSLESVPDALKHKLSQLLCDSRRMNAHIFKLLVGGSPTEIRLRDCSWLTEEEFTKSFQMCDTTNLVVLQLDQCGRCMPDYVVLATLAETSKSLPRLTSLSISGACRLSDGGLYALVSSAPALRSINLSQCSLLTPASLNMLADSYGSLLKELYLDDCQSIDATVIVPSLKKLQGLEVLSVAGIQTVSDKFIKSYITSCGQKMKELVLRDCVKLTDSSTKVIAEHCPGLCALNLTNLCKLTDLSIKYLTNGCQALQTLKLCRNQFSDGALAAFVETNGESLKELSLNNVKKVDDHTALSLARHAKNLHTLDLSWCRNLTDNAVGFIVDSCLSLRLLKLFGCTQITDVFLNGHSNPGIRIVGLKLSPVLQDVRVPDHQEGALHYAVVTS